LDSERGIAWRASDSLAIRSFLGLALDEAAHDHSTISRTRRLIDIETHRSVFTWVLGCLANAGLIRGKTVGIDATTLEANAATRSIVRRDTGDTYQEYLTDLAKASGRKTPTRAALVRLDRRRQKKASNKDWTNPTDPSAKITKMKDGRTHLAHKAEHAIDVESGALVVVTVQGADRGDTTTMTVTLTEARNHIEELSMKTTTCTNADGLLEVVADKGYHSDRALIALEDLGLRSYICEPDRGRRVWKNNVAAQMAVYANRRRMRGDRGIRLRQLRGERMERPFAHLYETGGMRRTHLRGHTNILKRLQPEPDDAIPVWCRQAPTNAGGRLCPFRPLVSPFVCDPCRDTSSYYSSSIHFSSMLLFMICKHYEETFCERTTLSTGC
jgi:transposase